MLWLFLELNDVAHSVTPVLCFRDPFLYLFSMLSEKMKTKNYQLEVCFVLQNAPSNSVLFV